MPQALRAKNPDLGILDQNRGILGSEWTKIGVYWGSPFFAKMPVLPEWTKTGVYWGQNRPPAAYIGAHQIVDEGLSALSTRFFEPCSHHYKSEKIMLYLTNAFSWRMLRSTGARIDTVSLSDVRAAEMWTEAPVKICAIGHQDLAAVAADMLVDPNITANRANVCLEEDDTLLVARLTGGTLPEGATTLPKGFEIEWIVVRVKYFIW